MNTTNMPDLIRQAIAAVNIIRHDDRYVLDMDYYHSPDAHAGKCRVCLAGCVMATEPNDDPSKFRSPEAFEGPLAALSGIAFGLLDRAAERLGVELPEGIAPRQTILQPGESGQTVDGFLADLATLADRWEAAQPRP